MEHSPGRQEKQDPQLLVTTHLLSTELIHMLMSHHTAAEPAPSTPYWVGALMEWGRKKGAAHSHSWLSSCELGPPFPFK